MIEQYDLVIAGGGVAGLMLALQRLAKDPQQRIAVVEKQASPVPIAAHKVGESGVEVSAHYQLEVIGLRDHVREKQLPKHGLRFWLGDNDRDFAERLEFGPRQFPVVPSIHVDRGVLENHLRERVVAEGGVLFDGYSVTEIVLGTGEQPHRTAIRGRGQSDERTLESRWLVDAMGRRRFLQTQLGLDAPSHHPTSTSWWRVKGILDVAMLRHGEREDVWSQQADDWRWMSTNHLMGHGYWVWIIPLGSDYTSVGIVADERVHPVREYATEEKARAWLRKHEPALAQLIEPDQFVDFLVLKNFSHWSKQVFSTERWACVGDAGIFADPLYSPGGDFIAFANTIVSQMIDLDRRGALTEQIVDDYNRFMLEDLGIPTLEFYRDNYPLMGTARVWIPKANWDTCYYWSLPASLFFKGHLDHESILRFRPIVERGRLLNHRVQKMFRDWSVLYVQRGLNRGATGFVPYSGFPLFRDLHRALAMPAEREQTFAQMEKRLLDLERFAYAAFEVAVEDCLPDSRAALAGVTHVDACGVSLTPTSWQDDGLFMGSLPLDAEFDAIRRDLRKHLLTSASPR